MDYIVTWHRRPPTNVPFEPEMPKIEQFFQTRQQVVQYLYENARNPDFIFVELQSPGKMFGYMTSAGTPMKLHEYNAPGIHVFGGGDMCIKCDARKTNLDDRGQYLFADGVHSTGGRRLGEDQKCKAQVYDPPDR